MFSQTEIETIRAAAQRNGIELSDDDLTKIESAAQQADLICTVNQEHLKALLMFQLHVQPILAAKFLAGATDAAQAQLAKITADLAPAK